MKKRAAFVAALQIVAQSYEYGGTAPATMQKVDLNALSSDFGRLRFSRQCIFMATLAQYALLNAGLPSKFDGIKSLDSIIAQHFELWRKCETPEGLGQFIRSKAQFAADYSLRSIRDLSEDLILIYKMATGFKDDRLPFLDDLLDRLGRFKSYKAACEYYQEKGLILKGLTHKTTARTIHAEIKRKFHDDPDALEIIEKFGKKSLEISQKEFSRRKKKAESKPDFDFMIASEARSYGYKPYWKETVELTHYNKRRIKEFHALNQAIYSLKIVKIGKRFSVWRQARLKKDIDS